VGSIGEDGRRHVDVRHVGFEIRALEHGRGRQTLYDLRDRLNRWCDKGFSQFGQLRLRPQHNGRKRDFLLQRDAGREVQLNERLFDFVHSRSGRQLELAVLGRSGRFGGDR